MLRERGNLLQPFLIMEGPTSVWVEDAQPCSLLHSDAMNSTSCVGDFRNDRDGLNSDPTDT